jgi:Holliday junction DNA helicase RuvA
MIGRLTGKVVAQEAEGAAVVDVGGVGYEVLVPLGTIGRAASDEGGRCTLYVHTHAREDALTLFGFATDADRLTFRTLIGVSNVGPRTALAILSTLPAEDLARAIAAKDLAKLTGIPGIGKKTAERLVLELRDRLVKPVAVAARSEGPSSREAPVAPWRPSARSPRSARVSTLSRWPISCATRSRFWPSDSHRRCVAHDAGRKAARRVSR